MFIGKSDNLLRKKTSLLRVEKYQEAIPVCTEALEVSLNMDDVLLSIGILETLGIWQRALGDHNAVWGNWVRHRRRRCIEPEAVFGQMRHNMECNTAKSRKGAHYSC